MGGYGSGRPSGTARLIVEACRSIDVNELHKLGSLRSGWRGVHEWTCDGEKVASVMLRAEGEQLHLSYNVQNGYGGREVVTETVPIVREPCRFGGSRAYFICPGVVDETACRRRVIKLYEAGRYFLCRHCYRLAYASQNEDPFHRAHRRANKIRERLGGDPGTEFPERPKGMWRRTYERLRGQAFEIDMLAEDAFDLAARQLLDKIDRRGRRKTNIRR